MERKKKKRKRSSTTRRATIKLVRGGFVMTIVACKAERTREREKRKRNDNKKNRGNEIKLSRNIRFRHSSLSHSAQQIIRLVPRGNKNPPPTISPTVNCVMDYKC